MTSNYDEGIDGLVDNSTEIPPFEFTDYTQRVIVATLILIVFVVGTIGNAMVILAVLLSKRLRITPIFAFVVNQSAADLLTCLMFPWDAVALLGKDGLPVAEWVCSAATIIKFTTIGCSICTLTSIGMNRLLLIAVPATTFRKIFTPIKIAVWLVIIWLFPFLVFLIPPLVDVGAVGFNEQYHFCASKSSHPRFNTYNFIRVVALFPIPLLIIIISFISICIHLRRHAKMAVTSPEEPGSIPMVPQSKDGIGSDQHQSLATLEFASPSQMSSLQNEISKNILYVMCGFVLCLTPYAIIIFLDIGPIVPYINATLYSNSCINPLIYVTLRRDFKTIFGSILRRKWDQIP